MPHFVLCAKDLMRGSVFVNVQRIISVQRNSLNAKSAVVDHFHFYFHLILTLTHIIIWFHFNIILFVYFISFRYNYYLLFAYISISLAENICLLALMEFLCIQHSWTTIFDMVRIEKKSLESLHWMNLKCIET